MDDWTFGASVNKDIFLKAYARLWARMEELGLWMDWIQFWISFIKLI